MKNITWRKNFISNFFRKKNTKSDPEEDLYRSNLFLNMQGVESKIRNLGEKAKVKLKGEDLIIEIKTNSRTAFLAIYKEDIRKREEEIKNAIKEFQSSSDNIKIDFLPKKNKWNPLDKSHKKAFQIS